MKLPPPSRPPLSSSLILSQGSQRFGALMAGARRSARVESTATESSHSLASPVEDSFGDSVATPAQGSSLPFAATPLARPFSLRTTTSQKPSVTGATPATDLIAPEGEEAPEPVPPPNPPAQAAAADYVGESGIDLAWLHEREAALIDIRADYDAARAQALALPGSPGWVVFEVMSESGNEFRMDFDEAVFLTSFAASYASQGTQALQTLARLYDSEVADVLSVPGVLGIAAAAHALNAGPPPAGEAMGSAAQLGMVDLYLADPQIQTLIDRYGGAPPQAIGAIALEQVRVYGQARYEQMGRLSAAMQRVRNDFVTAFNQAANADGGFIWQSEGFDADAFTAWYEAQPEWSNQVFASFYGASHAQYSAPAPDESGASPENYLSALTFDNPNWVLDPLFFGTGGMLPTEFIGIDPNDNPGLFDHTAIGFDLEAGWVTPKTNVRDDPAWFDRVFEVAAVALVSYVSAQTLGPAAAQAFGFTKVAATGATVLTSTGLVVSASVAGAASAAANGIISGEPRFKDILRGALAGGLTQELMGSLSTVIQKSPAAAITGRTVVQGGVQALLGGEFEDGAITGFAAGLAGLASDQLNTGIAKALADRNLTPAQAQAGRLFSKMMGSAIRAAANPGDPSNAFASAFLEDLIEQTRPESGPGSVLAFDDEGHLMPGVVDTALPVDQQMVQLQARLASQGVDATHAQSLAIDYFAGIGALPPAAYTPPAVAARDTQRTIGQLAERYGGIAHIPASELKPLVPTLAVDQLPLVIAPTQVAGIGDNVLGAASRGIAITAGAISGIVHGAVDSALGLGELAVTASNAQVYMLLGGESGLGGSVPGGKQAYETMRSIGETVGSLLVNHSELLPRLVGAAGDWAQTTVAQVQAARGKADQSDSLADWMAYGQVTGVAVFDMASLVLGPEAKAGDAAKLATRLAQFEKAAEVAKDVEIVATASGKTGIWALPELDGVEATAKGFVNSTKTNSSAHSIFDYAPEERALSLRVVAGEDVDGKLTEELVERVAVRHGMTSLEGGKYGSNNGFDVVLQAPDGTVTLVVDAKQMRDGTLRLAVGANGYLQNSDRWVREVLGRIDPASPAYRAVERALDESRLVKGIAAVDRSSGNLTIVKVN